MILHYKRAKMLKLQKKRASFPDHHSHLQWLAELQLSFLVSETWWIPRVKNPALKKASPNLRSTTPRAFKFQAFFLKTCVKTKTTASICCMFLRHMLHKYSNGIAILFCNSKPRSQATQVVDQALGSSGFHLSSCPRQEILEVVMYLRIWNICRDEHISTWINNNLTAFA